MQTINNMKTVTLGVRETVREDGGEARRGREKGRK